MTRYLDVSAVSKLVQTIGLNQVISDMAGYIVADYKRWDAFEKSARTANHTSNGVVELMPVSDQAHFSFKYVNGHPSNIEKGLSTVMAFGVLSEMDTGKPLLLSEMTLTTAIRTAATSAVVARHAAKKNCKIMAVIGCGAQSEFQIIAFRAMMGIKEFHVYDRDEKSIHKLRQNLSIFEDIEIRAATSIEEAVKMVDIITTVTADKKIAALLTPSMLKKGVHINAVGGDCPGKTEIPPEILKNSRVIVEYEPQTRIEGDIQQMPSDFPVIELWKVFMGKEVGRQNEDQITVFDSVGFALEDFSALRYLNDIAIKQNAGTTIDLMPTLADPKNLYALLQPVSMPAPPVFKATVNVEKKAK
jgi:ornithine cyclodeaminase